MKATCALPRVAVGLLAIVILPALFAETSEPRSNPQPLSLIVGKSRLVESSLPIERIAVGSGEIAEASAMGLH